jgi:hypothetical protein
VYLWVNSLDDISHPDYSLCVPEDQELLLKKSARMCAIREYY